MIKDCTCTDKLEATDIIFTFDKNDPKLMIYRCNGCKKHYIEIMKNSVAFVLEVEYNTLLDMWLIIPAVKEVCLSGGE